MPATQGLDIGLFGMKLDVDSFDDSLLGARVRLHGLTGEQAAHNGELGVASEFHLLKGIYFVTMGTPRHPSCRQRPCCLSCRADPV